MSRRPGWAMTQVYVQHARWLEDQGPSYKHQAASAKRQAASLTRKNYGQMLRHSIIKIIIN